ncbi:MAG: GTP-binding protein, partial [Nocardioides sp.]
DDRVLARWVAGEPARRGDVLRALRQGVRRGALTPLVCGSAITGAGTSELRQVLTGILSRTPGREGALAGTVFAVDRDERGRRAWIRLWSGELRVRDRVAIGDRRPERVTEVAVSEPGGVTVDAVARAGQIAVVRGPTARIGDTLGRPPRRRTHRFPPATLQALVEPEDPTKRTALYAGLTELAEEDPLIDLRLDEVDGEAAVSLHGEVQKEVIAALLEQRYGVRARFLETSVVCLERVIGTGASVDRIRTGGNPYLAGIGLRVEAASTGHGIEFSPGVERGNLPPAFVTATEEGVRSALRQGLHGWAVTDCVVTMTESGYFPRQSKPHQKFDKSISSVAADFRNLAPVVVMAALAQAGTRVCQPVDRFELELPDEVFGSVAPLLGRLGASTLDTAAAGGYTRIASHLPSAAVPDLASRLPDLTRGEGVLVRRLDRPAPVTASRLPSRRRTGFDPLDRTAWFRHVSR